MNDLIDYAKSFLKTPYLWGGKNMLNGCDCSGLVSELLKSAGEISCHAEMNAQEIFDHYDKLGFHAGVASAGALAFYGESVTKIHHVVFCINPYQAIGADGGDGSCTSPEIAAQKGAFVKIRPVKSDRYRLDLVGFVKPRYSGIGLI